MVEVDSFITISWTTLEAANSRPLAFCGVGLHHVPIDGATERRPSVGPRLRDRPHLGTQAELVEPAIRAAIEAAIASKPSK